MYSLHKYANYEEYYKIQVKGNRDKITNTWATEKNIKFICEIISNMNPKFGICHGSRRGKEQLWFMRHLPGCEVIGTEISPTAKKFPNTIEWDFHEMKPEWKSKFDFVYSNSWDHAYDPELALKNWMASLNKKGILFLEHSESHLSINELDPFGIEASEFIPLIKEISHGLYKVINILKAPNNKKNRKIIIVGRI